MAIPGGDADTVDQDHAGGPLGSSHERHGKNFARAAANYKSIATTNKALRKATFVFARPHYFSPHCIRRIRSIMLNTSVHETLLDHESDVNIGWVAKARTTGGKRKISFRKTTYLSIYTGPEVLAASVAKNRQDVGSRIFLPDKKYNNKGISYENLSKYRLTIQSLCRCSACAWLSFFCL